MGQHCCHGEHDSDEDYLAAHAHHGRKGGSTTLRTAAQATLHCLTGCVIGEVAGLMIGVSAGLGVWAIMLLGTLLAFIAGFALTLGPIMKRESLSLKAAMRVVWIGEAVSITVMEIVMNIVDYLAGGMAVMSVTDPLFWRGLAFAVPAGYIAALPVNYWLLKRELKRCH